MKKERKNKKAQRNKTNKKGSHTSDLFPFSWDASKELFVDNDGHYIQMVQTNGTNLFGFNRNDQESYMMALQSCFSSQTGYGQIFSFDVGANVDGYIEDYEYFKNCINVSESDEENARYQILLESQNRLKYSPMTREMVDRVFLFVLKDKDSFKLMQRCEEIKRCLNPYQKTSPLEPKAMTEVIYNYFHPRNEKVMDKMFVDLKESNDIMDFIYPDYISKQRKGVTNQYLIMDGLYVKVLYLSAFRKTPPMAFLSYITALRDVDVSIHYAPAPSDAIRNEVSKSLKNVNKNLNNTRDNADRIALQKESEQLEEVLAKMVADSDQPIHFGVTIRIKGESIEEVDDYIREIQKKLDEMSIYFRTGVFQQYDMLIQNAPLCQNTVEQYMKTTTRDVMGWSYPFVFESLYDSVEFQIEENGRRVHYPPVFLGNTIMTGGVCFYDNFTKLDDRSNYNEFIAGTSGFGKTFFIMWLIYCRFGLGYKQFLVDVEGKELNKLVNYLGGENINCADGTKGRINPLEIRFIIPDDDDSSESVTDKKIPLEEIKPLAEHLRFMKNFLKAYKGDSTEIGLLNDSTIERVLIEIYARKNITFDTTAKELLDNYTSEDYPIFHDLYNELKAKAKMRIEHYESAEQGKNVYIDEDELKRLNECISFIEPLAVGSDSPIFNGHTNINTDSKLINFNISQLSDNTSNKTLQTQYYNIMSFIWTSIVSNPKAERQQLYADEFSVIMDPRNEDIMLFFRNIIKRIRKYYGGLTTATQQLDDVLNELVKSHGKAIIANSCYQFYFGLGANDLSYIKDAEMIPESEIEFVKTANIGECYAKFGSATAMEIKIGLPQSTLELFERIKP
ncbi:MULTISPECIES: hypothetical protein [unclassified Breznakia]|uniref:VirB4 family type IV secretion system protein n=1 Tax=unclassified Breznakia TaxID=2623764 RepID=UPI0024731D7F|nr:MULTISPECIES: hypothetical protein [unclassified Breznakia]MDH6367394.1 hypothetical protein [Breznakia sp. PH1-1]MDH6403926.1 hypothetical protein [Breznakia sp. PF1-11]MDH6411635.1 hypothetical protein [Breznakia sp. PFB1-11]MDH6414561.1 hypothetical protein [Breznakia sp. PFB1-14]MDH6418667.1 hypothetical protein [Breznakia sp. PFB1-12]